MRPGDDCRPECTADCGHCKGGGVGAVVARRVLRDTAELTRKIYAGGVNARMAMDHIDDAEKLARRVDRALAIDPEDLAMNVEASMDRVEAFRAGVRHAAETYRQALK